MEDLKQRSQHDGGWHRFLTTLGDKGYFKVGQDNVLGGQGVANTTP